MNEKLKIQTLRVDDLDDVRLQVTLANEICKCSLQFYCEENVFNDFSKQLIDFPQNLNDTAIFQIGQESYEHAYFLEIKVLCVEPNGKSILKILMDNHGDNITGYRCQFNIDAEIADINKLGRSLLNWKTIEGQEFSW
jgi:hypothetical protein